MKNLNKHSFVNVFKVLIYFVFVFGIIIYLSDVYGSKNYENVDNYNKDNDVLFVGSSDMLKAVSPMVLYREYGTAAFNVGDPYSQMPIFEYFIKKDTSDYKPKVIVLEADTLISKDLEAPSSLQQSLDKDKLSIQKISLINQKINEYDFWWKTALTFPFLRFHSKWNKLDYDDYTLNRKYERCTSYNCYNYIFDSEISKGQMTTEGDLEMSDPDEAVNTKFTSYLLIIKKYCDENNIKLMLVSYPMYNWSDVKSKLINDYLAQYNIDYLDLNNYYDEIGFNFQTDFRDLGHANISGATKITKYLGKYLVDKYNLSDRREDPKYSKYNEDLKLYDDYEKDCLKTYNVNLTEKENNDK